MKDVLEFTMRDLFVPLEKTEHWHKEESCRFLPGRHESALYGWFQGQFEEEFAPEDIIITAEKVFLVFPVCVKYEDRPDSLEMTQVHLEHAIDGLKGLFAPPELPDVTLRSYDWDIDLDSGIHTNY